MQRDTTIASLSRSLSVTWQSLWQLNPNLPHPDFSLQVSLLLLLTLRDDFVALLRAFLNGLHPRLERCCNASVPVKCQCASSANSRSQPASVFHIGRLLKLPLVPHAPAPLLPVTSPAVSGA